MLCWGMSELLKNKDLKKSLIRTVLAYEKSNKTMFIRAFSRCSKPFFFKMNFTFHGLWLLLKTYKRFYNIREVWIKTMSDQRRQIILHVQVVFSELSLLDQQITCSDFLNEVYESVPTLLALPATLVFKSCLHVIYRHCLHEAWCLAYRLSSLGDIPGMAISCPLPFS